ncbi:hypothetical protein [Enterococcus faecium]|uniref:hypothetical protein n=1 Tax=Enterococcus faecium TaxID=1352 RepID=UPI0021FE3C34|nr:hypothetical protein [Enterococcus faecium]BDP47017.1 hypothetical protein EfmJHP9_18870 [Enterococcus faecium]
MNDQPSKIAEAIHLAKKTLKIVKQNIVFAIGIKILVLALGAFGFASMGDACLVSLLKIEYDYIWITNFYHKGENE